MGRRFSQLKPWVKELIPVSYLLLFLQRQTTGPHLDPVQAAEVNCRHGGSAVPIVS
jgi:hypothetical protein